MVMCLHGITNGIFKLMKNIHNFIFLNIYFKIISVEIICKFIHRSGRQHAGSNCSYEPGGWQEQSLEYVKQQDTIYVRMQNEESIAQH